MKCLVTGASGFVGKRLCAELLRQGYSVRSAVRSKAPLDENIEQVVVGPIDANTDWASVLNGVDVVIHLAARAHVLKEKAKDPLSEFLRVNLYGTERLAYQAASCGVKRLVYVSSIGVNGNNTNDGQVFSEASESNPSTPYADSKWQAELALSRISAITKLEVSIVRPPLIYGEGAPGNFAQMIRVLEMGVPLPLAFVNNQRSLVYIGNLVDALIVCATHPAANGQTYLVSDGEDISTPELLRRLGASMGHPARLFPCSLGLLRLAGHVIGKSDQVERLVGSLQVDSGKIRRELNWTPPYTLQQGLQATAGWYQNTHQ